MDRKNYRPITFLSIVNKIFDQKLSDQVPFYQYVSLQEVRICETALLKLVEDWKLSLDNGQIVRIISTDSSKAFDSLLPALMIRKLKSYNFSKQSLTLLRSYFECNVFGMFNITISRCQGIYIRSLSKFITQVWAS